MPAEPRNHVRAVKIAVDQSAHDQYVSQIKAFSEALGFSVQFSQTSPDPNDVVAHLARDDVWMIATLGSQLFGGPDLVYEFSFIRAAIDQCPRNFWIPWWRASSALLVKWKGRS